MSGLQQLARPTSTNPVQDLLFAEYQLIFLGFLDSPSLILGKLALSGVFWTFLGRQAVLECRKLLCGHQATADQVASELAQRDRHEATLPRQPI